jgi:periplasmic protein TonB
MKTKEKIEENLDEIVFSNRNKAYGAYALRMSYPKYLSRALSISVAILLLSVSIPLIASYYGTHKNHFGEETVVADIANFKTPPEAPPVPPPQPPADLLAKMPRFSVPIIVDSAESTGSFNQDDLLKTGINRTNDTTETHTNTTTLPPPVIDPVRKTEPFLVVEEMPTFPGGDEARIAFLHSKLLYPEIAKTTGISGTVYIEFVVDESGNSTEINLKRGIGGGCDQEAARVVRMMHWNPGRQSGKAVPVKFTIGIKFTLN